MIVSPKINYKPRIGPRRDILRDPRPGARVDGNPGRQPGSANGGGSGVCLYPEVSRSKLARLLGVHASMISRVLSGKRRPGLELATGIAWAVGVTVDELYQDMIGVKKSCMKTVTKEVAR